jgi:hypothetical protein
MQVMAMVFSPRSAVLGLLVLTPIAASVGNVFGGSTGLIVGCIFGIALSVLGSYKKAKEPPTDTPTKNALLSDERECPFCAETIKKKAKVCRYCGRELAESGGQ